MKILVCMLYKNSMLWLDRQISCLDNLLRDTKNITYTFSVVYGDSKDGTDTKVKENMNLLQEKYSEILKVKLIHFPLPRRLDTIEKLATLRNISVYGVEDNIHSLEEYDYILHIDTDVFFRPLEIQKLINILDRDVDAWGNKLNAGIIAPMILIENAINASGSDLFYDTFAYRIDKRMFTPQRPFVPITIDYKNPNNQTLVNEILDKTINKGIFEVDSVGTCYLCRADIFSKYNIKYGTILRKENKLHSHIKNESEQVVWCMKVKENTPYKIYVDADTYVRHVNLEQLGMRWH